MLTLAAAVWVKLLQLAVAVLCLQANAQKVQKRLIINKPRHLAGLAADIVERVVTTGPEPYLEIRMPSLAWWQLALLDVKSIWHVIMTAACLAFFVLLCIAMCAMCWVMIVSASNEVAGSDEHDSVHEHES